MKTIISIFVIALTSISYSQTIFEVTPGTKGNEISLRLANVSEIIPAENVNITLFKKPSSVNFKNETETVKLIEPNKEELVIFTFDVSREAPVNRKDTIDFMVTDLNGTSLIKSFFFNYTAPKEFKLEQNFPNPFNPTTTIQYQLPANSKVTLKVYDILGSEVTTLVNEEQEAGYKEVKFSTGSFGNASNFASGMYIYRLTADKYSSTKKMILLR